jgi:Family of unknown function (DUF6384)
MPEAVAESKAPLDEVMLAMDVVDTLRHRERVLEQALTSDERDAEMMARLKQIYSGQGIDVSDDVLAEGVKALREERFVYTPPAPGLGTALGRVYVTRGRWGKPLAAGVAVVAAVLVGYQLLVRGPALAEIEALPAELEAEYSAVVDLAIDDAVDMQAAAILGDGRSALGRDDYAGARTAIGQLDALHATLAQAYELHVVSRPGELSGVWRVPDENPDAQNYYLIVEAIDGDGRRLTLPVVDQEDGKTRNVSRFGLRVDEATFQSVAADKRDDGIIQQDVVGAKRRGEMAPEYRPGVLGGAITDW